MAFLLLLLTAGCGVGVSGDSYTSAKVNTAESEDMSSSPVGICCLS